MPQPKKPQKPVSQNGLLRSLFSTAIMVLVIRSVIAEPYFIPSGSMKNTLLVGDRIFVNKIGCYLETPKYVPFTTIEIPHLHLQTGGVHKGEVVVFEYPGDRDEVVPHEKDVKYVKRLIGEPGDVVQIINKQVYVNGKAQALPSEGIVESGILPKGAVEPNIFPNGMPWNHDNYGPLRVPKSGDIIPISNADIDQWNVFIQREGHQVTIADNNVLIDGKPATSYKVQHDYLFMMGDNRDNSEDSRYWGFVPVENVTGTAAIVYASWYNPPTQIPPASSDVAYDPDEAQVFHIRWDRFGHLVH